MSLWGNAANTATAQPSLFNTTAQNKPAFPSLNTSTSQAPALNLFGQSQQQPLAGGSLFGQPAQTQTQTQQPASTSLFGQPNNAPNLGQSQQPQQRPFTETLRFGFGDSQQTVAQAQTGKDEWWQQGKGMAVLRTIPEQMMLLKNKWDPATLQSPLRTYIYQHVSSETEALKYSPSQNEDPDKWEEAVQSRPGPEWVPVIAMGFKQLGERGKAQMEALARCNMMLNEINTSLDIQLDVHRQKVAARLEQSRRRHKVVTQRVLVLASKVQRLKNRGYVMDNDEEELKSRLTKLEAEILDPSIRAREQEIWARMLGISQRVKRLKEEMDKLQPAEQTDEPLLDDETVKIARKVSSIT